MTYYEVEPRNRLAYEYDPDIYAYADEDDDEYDEYICTEDNLED